MIVQVKDIIKSSMRVIGVLAKSESPSDDEYADCLQALNFMLNKWSVHNLMLLGTVLEAYPLVAGTVSYTIGTGAVFNTSKPSKIDLAFVRDANGIDSSLIIDDQMMYNLFDDKSYIQSLPVSLYYDKGLTQQAVETGTIYLYPIPDRAYTLFIGEEKPLTNFASIEDLVTFPPAYHEALKYSLAIRIYREFHEHGNPIPADIVGLAKTAVDTIERMNSKRVVSVIDLPVAGGKAVYNVMTDESR